MSLIKINNIIDIENNIFKFNNKNITITYDEHDNVWFKGKDVCDILKYKKSEDAIKRHVENEDKIEYKKLNLDAPLKQGGRIEIQFLIFYFIFIFYVSFYSIFGFFIF